MNRDRGTARQVEWQALEASNACQLAVYMFERNNQPARLNQRAAPVGPPDRLLERKCNGQLARWYGRAVVTGWRCPPLHRA
jgi:hypothetical protein